MVRMILALMFLALLKGSISAAGFDHTHEEFSRILKAHVSSQHLVNYSRLKGSPAELKAYLKTLSKVSQKEFTRWNESQQIAYLLNLYCADLQLIIDNHPIAVKKIAYICSLKKFVPLFGKTVSLGHIEHEILRKNYEVPEIHFALVCAAKGCPPLRDEAYRADQLDKQLVEQGRRFLANPAKNRVDVGNRRVHLSPIFKWFDEDFEKKSGSVIGFIQDYLPRAVSKQLRPDFRIEYTDWALNE